MGDLAVCRASGSQEAPYSRRLGEQWHVRKMIERVFGGPEEQARIVNQRLTPQLIRHYRRSLRHLWVFVDKTTAEVEGLGFRSPRPQLGPTPLCPREFSCCRSCRRSTDPEKR